MNKRLIDPICPRHVAVKSEGRVKLRLNNGPAEPEDVSVPKHKKNPDVGVKTTTRTKVGFAHSVRFWASVRQPSDACVVTRVFRNMPAQILDTCALYASPFAWANDKHVIV